MPSGSNLHGRTMQAMAGALSPLADRVGKRALDVAVAGAALVIAAPVMAGVALLVWHDVGRPVLFSQVRPGRGEAPFRMWKFRTMRDALDAQGEALPDHERLTRIGRLLRATSLDELPELWNVLRGEMSLVGPRPLLVDYLPLYGAHHRRRHEVKPGITGWAQVNGRNSLAWDDKLDLDVWYVDHRTLWLDVVILARTVVAVVRRDGIAHAGSDTMPRFQGSGRAGHA